jgi:PAS domain S-box-containing protein
MRLMAQSVPLRTKVDEISLDSRYRLLIEAVTDYAIYMLDPHGNITSWNPGARRFKGYEADEIIGQNFSRFYTEEDRAAGLPQRALRIAREEGRFEGEGWRVRKDGTQFWVNVVVDPIRGEDGTLIGFAKITRDLTERRRTQAELERAREALFQSQKMEAVGQLTGGVAHDFNNLLMAVLSSLELLRKRLPDDPRTQLLLNNALEGARRGANLTRRMLAFARRQELALTNLDIGTLVGGMSGLLERSVGPAIVIEHNIPLGLPLVRADANQLESALLNLVVNARDAMQDGGAITISARIETPGDMAAVKSRTGEYVCLSVADTGHGMDDATLQRAMEPFFTTKGVGKGTGLGLSMVHGMAEQLGGTFVLKSRKGHGTTAELWLPVAQGALNLETPSAAAASHQATRALTCLLVDDDRLVLVNTSAMLEELGHKVIEASSAKLALESLRRGDAVDIVISDYAMPQSTGIELAKAIHAAWPDVPVLLVTGYADLPPGVETTLPRLTKPFSLDDLESAITACTQLGPHVKTAFTSSHQGAAAGQ